MNTPCTHIQQLIVQSLHQQLDLQQSQQVHDHVQSCPACQSYEQTLRNQDKELEQMARKLTKTLTEKQNKAIAALENLPAPVIHERKWIKYAVAASILIIIGLSLYALKIPIDGTTKLYAMSDVPELFNSARTLHIKGRRFFPEHPGTEPAETEYWLDIENGRWRSEGPSYCVSEEVVDVWYSKNIYDGQGLRLSIDSRQKTCQYYELSEFQQNLYIQQIPKKLLQIICGAPEHFDTYQIQDQETINGKTYNIWESLIDLGPIHFKTISWLSPQTGHLAKAEFWQSIDGQQWALGHTFDIVEINNPIDESVFELTIPESYTASNTIDTPRKMALGKSISGMSSVWIEYYLLFALPDNRLVMCWRNKLLENPEQEGQYFNDLQFGGPVPKLPAEVYGLKTQIDGKEYLWQGKHLAFTQKDGKFYEWAIYVPEQAPPTKPNHVYTYTHVYRMNNDDNACVTSAGSPDITIENQVDFEKFIIEGMRELSDDPTMDAPFTLEDVLSISN